MGRWPSYFEYTSYMICEAGGFRWIFDVPSQQSLGSRIIIVELVMTEVFWPVLSHDQKTFLVLIHFPLEKLHSFGGEAHNNRRHGQVFDSRELMRHARQAIAVVWATLAAKKTPAVWELLDLPPIKDYRDDLGMVTIAARVNPTTTSHSVWNRHEGHGLELAWRWSRLADALPLMKHGKISNLQMIFPLSH